MKTEIGVKDICRYIDALVTKGKYYITLHGDCLTMPELVRYNFHLNPYCRYIKTVCSNWDVCVQKQKGVLDKCGGGEFFGVCHAGVGEYVYPITVGGKAVGFISVSGYKGADEAAAAAKATHFANKNRIKAEELLSLRDEFLNSVIPDKSETDAVIRPLVFMMEFFTEQQLRRDDSDDLYTRLTRYITENHSKHITVRDLSEKFNYSVSTISHMFAKRSGMSVSEYIQNLRLDESIWLLKQPDFTVTQVSDCLGFCNSAYFSSVFKKRYGISPKEYRKIKCKLK